MKLFYRILLYCSIVIGVFFAHFFVSNVLFFPLYYIHFVFLFFILWINIGNGYKALAALVPVCMMLEMLSTTPFGANAIALFVSLSVANWFLKNVFTNHSLLIVFLSVFLGMILYKLIFFIFILAFFILRYHQIFPLVWKETLADAGLSVLMTSVAAILVYTVISILLVKSKPKYQAIGASTI